MNAPHPPQTVKKGSPQGIFPPILGGPGGGERYIRPSSFGLRKQHFSKNEKRVIIDTPSMSRSMKRIFRIFFSPPEILLFKFHILLLSRPRRIPKTLSEEKWKKNIKNHGSPPGFFLKNPQKPQKPPKWRFPTPGYHINPYSTTQPSKKCLGQLFFPLQNTIFGGPSENP